MSSCNIRYISDSKNGFTPDQIEDLTSKHIDVSKILYRHRYNNSDEKQDNRKQIGRIARRNKEEIQYFLRGYVGGNRCAEANDKLPSETVLPSTNGSCLCTNDD